MPLILPRRDTREFSEESFGSVIAVEDAIFATFFDIENELHGESVFVWPLGVGGVFPISDEVTIVGGRVVSVHVDVDIEGFFCF